MHKKLIKEQKVVVKYFVQYEFVLQEDLNFFEASTLVCFGRPELCPRSCKDFNPADARSFQAV